MKQLISYYRMPGDREEEILRLIHAEGLDGVENLIYGNGDDPCGRLCLHAYVLCFYHPVTHQPMEFETPIPAAFLHIFK